MVRIYANRIEDGAKKITDVPTKIREDVKALVIADGYEFDEEGYAHKAGKEESPNKKIETEVTE